MKKFLKSLFASKTPDIKLEQVPPQMNIDTWRKWEQSDVDLRKKFEARLIDKELIPFSYDMIRAEFDLLYHKSMNLDEPFVNYPDIERVRLSLQKCFNYYNHHRFGFLYDHIKIRLPQQEQVLQCNVDGKIVLTSQGIKSYEFAEQVYDYICQRIAQFVQLSEREKTIRLLKQFNINVNFCRNSHSWIVNPNFWVLSDQAPFITINQILLKAILSGKADELKSYFPILFFAIIGCSSLFTRNPDNYSRPSFNLEFFQKLCGYCNFYPRQKLLRKFIKSNRLPENKLHLSTAHFNLDISYNTIGSQFNKSIFWVLVTEKEYFRSIATIGQDWQKTAELIQIFTIPVRYPKQYHSKRKG